MQIKPAAEPCGPDSYLADNNANYSDKSGKNPRQEKRWIGLIWARWDSTKCHSQGRLGFCSDLGCFHQSLTFIPIWERRLPSEPWDAAVTKCDTIPHQRIKEFLQVSQNYFCLRVLHPVPGWESWKESDTQGRSQIRVSRCSILHPSSHQHPASSPSHKPSSSG